MKISILKRPSSIAAIVLGLIFILIVLKPVLPGKYMIKGMADSIDVKKIQLEKPIVIRFDLHGRGGGRYNLVAEKEKAYVMEGDPDQIDLYFSMEASEFNGLMINMARGRADEAVFRSLVIANKLKFAGDISVMGKLFSSKGGK